MSTRRRIGVSVATSESARRQLMQPVPCWEKVWVTPEDLPAGTTMKVFKWIKTDKKQNFSDDEGEADEPLAPLPDEPEVNEVEEEMDSVGPDVASRAVSEPLALPEETNETPAPHKPHPLSMSLAPPSPNPAPLNDEVLDEELKPLTSVPSSSLDDPTNINPEDLVNLDLSGLGPDGTQFEGSHDLTQMQSTDSLLGGEIMDESLDPFTSAHG